MKEIDYSSKSTSELIKIFEQACLEQYDTYITDDLETYDRNYDIQKLVTKELAFRGQSDRRSLLALLSHENPEVRLRAAKRVYPVARDQARKCLEALAAANLPGTQSLDAGMTLSRLGEVPDCLDH
ncbi:DUF2019 domain-containing protein [Roseiarcus fermentans]|uniref:DUF2019 domain-containing protein n=1 Tax=Roseiarcus fermentans TaxID=1473586 RepID=UPI000DE997BF|nr:DUF2019 domain-containing protein [Roseiarcus fermentans]